MKKTLTYPVIVTVLLLVLICNLIPVAVLPDSGLTVWSWVPAAVMLAMIFNGVIACLFKHKGDFFSFPKSSALWGEDKEETFTEAYEVSFRVKLLVFFMAIPCYLPIVFFAKSGADTLWTLLVYGVPQLVFLLAEIPDTLKEVKADQKKKAEREAEKREQEKKESMGQWK